MSGTKQIRIGKVTEGLEVLMKMKNGFEKMAMKKEEEEEKLTSAGRSHGDFQVMLIHSRRSYWIGCAEGVQMAIDTIGEIIES